MTAIELHPDARERWRAKRTTIASAALAPPSRLTLSEWADQYRILSADLGEPGPWRTSRVPYMREPMDAITDPRVREVVVMKSARIGATQALVLNAIGYYIHQEPSAIIVAVPTEQDAHKFSKQLLAPMIADTPVLRQRVADDKTRDSNNTILAKTYPGGGLNIVGTTSPRNMRMVHGRIVCMSEVDGYDPSAGVEGDQLMLLRRRAASYGAPKFILESTPLVKGQSRIEAAYELSDQRRYFVPCPHCDHGQVLRFGGRDVDFGLKWKDRDPSTARYLCEQCHHYIEEARKFRMVAEGDWLAQNPGVDVRGYHMNALMSPFPGARWPLIVAEFLAAKGKPEELKGFVNTVLGETFEEEGAGVDPLSLLSRLEQYPTDPETAEELVPGRVGILVRTVDVQGDRLETVVVGFGAGQEMWIVDYELIPGDPGTPEPWRQLAQRIGKQYRHEWGALLTPATTFIDSGGHHTKEVYEFCRPRQGQHVYAIKGANTEGAPLLARPTRNNSAKAILYMVGSFTAGEALFARLTKIREPGPGYIHAPDWLDTEQIQQLGNEKLVTRMVGGRPKRVWVTTGRNEFPDLLKYTFPALHRSGPAVVNNLAQLVERVQQQGAALKAQQTAQPGTEQHPLQRQSAPRRGGWVQGWRR